MLNNIYQYLSINGTFQNRKEELENLLDTSGAVCSSCDLEFIIMSEEDLDNYLEIRVVLMIDKIK